MQNEHKQNTERKKRKKNAKSKMKLKLIKLFPHTQNRFFFSVLFRWLFFIHKVVDRSIKLITENVFKQICTERRGKKKHVMHKWQNPRKYFQFFFSEEKRSANEGEISMIFLSFGFIFVTENNNNKKSRRNFLNKFVFTSSLYRLMINELTLL